MKQVEPLAASLTHDDRYRLLIDAVTDYAIYMLDPEGRVTSWNPGARRFKGYTEQEILGSHFSRFYSEQDRQAGLPARALETAAREGRFESDGWRVRKDGTRSWANVVIDPIREPAGRLIGFAKITRDLTERRLAEETLRRSQEQFRILVQGVTDYALYMLDPDGRVTSWNAGAQRIKGYRPEEIIGSHFSRFYTPEDGEKGEPRRALDTAIREGKFEKEGWRLRKDGSRFWAHVVIDPIRDEQGKLIGFAKITRDLTERRENQQALELAREALFQSQKMDAVGQLTGGIAHDFNNLLTAVLGSLELVRRRLPEDPRITGLVDNAIQAAQRGASLTQRMLAFARRQELDPEPIDVPTLVRGMTDLLQRSLGPSIEIETRFPLALGLVQADANQLEMALLNLAVNARDAMADGGRIVVAAREESVALGGAADLKPGRYICLSVADSGEGMDEATLARAMEPFFTTKGIGKGTGLGLSMIHGMAAQLGGQLVLKSQKGEGTTAELWLPASTMVAEPVERPQPPSAVAAPKATPLVVLAVDDDALVLMNTAAMLEDLGHKVLQAMSGRKALEILQKEKHVDLLIVDQAMPQMTGTQLIEAIRADRPDLPILLATGYAELPAGTGVGIPRLSKPFGQQHLADAVDAIMRAKQKAA
ncbi:MAG: PAS domain S-box protein [Reyranella sp.]|nr:PAS domain S-box protein [Reyranella sp.]MDP3163642.1 PAS domain S-box protein [Reyranella sp.]